MKKNKITGLIGTAVLHILLLILLLVIAIRRPQVQEEGGVPVMLGNTELSQGNADPYTLTDIDIMNEPEAPAPDVSEPETVPPVEAKEEIITQTEEETVAVPKKEPKKETPKKEKPKKETPKKETKKETPKKEEPKKETKKKVAKKESTLESDLEHMRESASASYRSKVYHISLREDGKWQVKFAKGEKVIKTFATQKEAIDYAKKLAENQDGSISIHKKDGKIRKLKY